MKRKLPAERRTALVAFCCTREEYEAILALSRKTICRTLSEYARKVLMAKPVAVKTRNLSLDDLVDTINGLRNEMEKLLEHQALNAADKIRLVDLIQEIKILFNKIADQCILK